MILAACEAAAMEAGFHAFELGATLTGEPLYRARGYEILERIEAALSNGTTLPIIRMKKTLDPPLTSGLNLIMGKA